MDNKNFKGMIAALERVSGEQKRVTGHLLEKNRSHNRWVN